MSDGESGAMEIDANLSDALVQIVREAGAAILKIYGTDFAVDNKADLIVGREHQCLGFR